MRRNEIEKKIQEMENRVFIIKMADRLNKSDWEIIESLEKEIKELKEKI